MGFRDNWRGSKELQLDTSDEAAKYYDATVTQFCGWYEDTGLGGIHGSLDRMLEADPEFVLGRALNLELELLGGMATPRLDKSLAKSVADLNALAEKKRAGNSLTDRDAMHVEVVNHWALNHGKKVRDTLERLVTVYPWDFAALKLNQDNYFTLGSALPMRNYLSYALKTLERSPKYSQDPNLSYLYGMYSFALEESNMYELAQENALKALQMNPRDTWAVHNYAHCLEMQGKTRDGLRWMNDRRSDWKQCQTLACHQYWHSTLFMINEGQFEEARALLDEEILSRCSNGSSCLDLHDAASMLYRLELIDFFRIAGDAGKSQQERWSGVYELCKPHKDDHLLGFNDAHYMMSYLGTGDLDTARQFIESARQQRENSVYPEVVVPLLQAMYAFKVEDYGTCTSLLESIRHDIIRIGGSHAQRDVFEQLLTVAAGRSKLPAHGLLQNRSVEERNARLGLNKQTQLLISASDSSYNMI